MACSADPLLHSDDDLRWFAGRLNLDPFERQVLALIGDGRTNRDIAAELGTDPQTVKKAVTSILRKIPSRDIGRLQAGALVCL